MSAERHRRRGAGPGFEVRGKHCPAFRPAGGPPYQVISDNDYAGDPDGLFQLAHHLLSPSVEMRAVIGSHLALGDPFVPSGDSAARAVEAASVVLELVGLASAVPVRRGSGLLRLDVRLMFEDLYAKLELAARVS